MNSKATKLFNIKHRLVLPGMSWVSTPALVAAVSNAGPLTSAETRESIREIRKRTDKPFGINAALLMTGSRENTLVALDEQVPVINYEQAHSYGGKVIATVTTEKHALSAVSSGADALIDWT